MTNKDFQKCPAVRTLLRNNETWFTKRILIIQFDRRVIRTTEKKADILRIIPLWSEGKVTGNYSG